MRIAILLPGYPRKYEVAYESLKAEYLDKHQCDIFMHSWYDTEKINIGVYSGMMDLFKPTKMLLEKQIIFDTSTERDKWHLLLQNTLSQFYSLYRANLLKCDYEKENGFKYDYVIRMRTDLRITRPINIDHIQPNCIAMYNWTELTFGFMGLSDVFAIGPSNLMDVYCDFYTKIKYYLTEDIRYKIPDEKTRPEYLLRYHLLGANDLKLQIFWHGDQSDPSFQLVR
jgi:hypothetical protein